MDTVTPMETQDGKAEPAAGANVFLVGMMGAGKTSVGKLLARQLGKSFVDSDQEIERRTGVRVAVIFDIEGEPGFRRREASVIRELTARRDIVLATGGGVVLDADNRAALAANGTVVYLRASVDELWNRTRHDKNRPLLRGGDPRERLDQLYRERDPIYCALADLIVDTGSQSLRNLVQKLQRELARGTPGAQAVAATPARPA